MTMKKNNMKKKKENTYSSIRTTNGKYKSVNQILNEMERNREARKWYAEKFIRTDQNIDEENHYEEEPT